MKTINEILDDINEIHPLECSYEADARYNYPAKMKAIREIIGDMVAMPKPDEGYEYKIVKKEQQ